MNSWLNKVSGISFSKKGGFLALLVIYVLGVAITYFFIAKTAYGPVHQGDENRYWNMAYDLYKGTFTLFGSHHHPFFYPFSILPAFHLFYPSGTYEAVKFLNVLYFTSVIFPSYLILRKFADRGLSLLVAAIILINPAQVVFPRSILSENVFYPVFMWAVFFAFTNISSPKQKRRYVENIIFGLLLAILLMTRYIALPLIPAMLLIWWIKPHEEERMPFLLSKKKFIQFLFVFVPMMLVLGIWIYFGIREGLAIKEVLGFTFAVEPNPLQLTYSRLFMWAVFYLSYTILIAAPYIGVLLISILFIRWKNWQDDLPRWYITIALIIICMLIVCIRHSWRAAYNFPDPVKLQERYIFYFGPLFLITAVAVIKKIKLPNLHSSDSGYVLFCIVSIGLVILSHSIFYRGFLFLGVPLVVSPSSPDGYLIESLNDGFPIICIFSIMATAWFMGRNQRLLLISILSLISLLFIVGNTKLHYENLLPRQYDNIQAFYLLKASRLNNNGIDIPDSAQITIRVKPGNAGEYTRWIDAFHVYGYDNIWIEEDLRLKSKTNYDIFVQANGYEYQINEVKKENYLSCTCMKYTFMGMYFTFQSTLLDK